MEKNENSLYPMTIDRIGNNLNKELNKQFREWESGLEYRSVLSSQAYRAKKLGMDVAEMAEKLEEMGYIKIVRTPKGKKFVFAGDCPWSQEEMQNWLQEQEIAKEAKSEAKREAKRQLKEQF